MIQNNRKMKEEKTIILGNASLNTGNRGCVALAYSLLCMIDKLFTEKGVKYKLYLTDSGNVVRNGQHTVQINGKSYLYEDLILPFVDIKDTVKALLREKNLMHCFGVLRHCDYVIDIGQGDSFADIYGTFRFGLIDKIHKCARKYGKPYALLPQTIGPFTDAAVRKRAAESVAKADLVMTRDRQSLEYVREIAPSAKAKEYIDVAFFLPYNRTSFHNGKINVGINISALLWFGGYTGDNQFNLGCDYPSVVRKIIDYFLQLDDNIVVHLVPHVVERDRDVENDYAVSYDILREYDNGRLVLAPLFLDPIEAKNYISGLDFFTGSRMHSTIAAFSSMTPVVPMAYSRKFNGLFEDTLHYHHLADLKKDSEERILEKIRTGFENRQALKEEEKQQMETTVKPAGDKMLQDLAQFFRL